MPDHLGTYDGDWYYDGAGYWYQADCDVCGDEWYLRRLRMWWANGMELPERSDEHMMLTRLLEAREVPEFSEWLDAQLRAREKKGAA